MCEVFPLSLRNFSRFPGSLERHTDELLGLGQQRYRNRVAYFVPLGTDMANRPIHITLAARDGTSGTFSYALSKDRGWDVCVEVDHRLVMQRHCRTWRSVEHCYDLLGRDLLLVDVHANLVVDIPGEAFR